MTIDRFLGYFIAGLMLSTLVSPTIAGLAMRMTIAAPLYWITGYEIPLDLVLLGS